MPRFYSITEPHPTVPSSGTFVLGGGIGGAGNYKRYNAADLTSGPNATGPASRVPLNRSSSSQRPIRVGRGGAGNMFAPPTTAQAASSEEAMFQFDEEMLARREQQAPVYHIGRGGAANWVNERAQRSSSEDNELRRADSHDSAASEKSAASSTRKSVEGAVGKFVRKLSARS